MGYLKDGIKAISWMGGLRVTIRLISLFKIVILARLLLPAQFGIYGITSLVLAFLEIFTETGINVFFIQHQKKINQFLDTAWVISIIRGFLIAFLVLLATPFVVNFFNVPEASQLLRLISLVPVIRGFINPAIIKFQSKLQFNKEYYFRSTLVLIEVLTSIGFALILRSPVSLVYGLIASAIFEVALSFYLSKPIPRFQFQSKHFQSIFHTGKWMTVAGIFNYLFHQGDDIVVGRMLSLNALGLYQQAYKISSLPISEVADSFGKVTFPIYSKIAGDRQRLKKAFIQVSLGISVLIIPFGLLLFLFPKIIIKILLGDNWLAAAPALKVLAVFGVIRAISGSASALFLAVKKQQFVTMITFVSILGLALSIIPLVLRFGIVGAGYSAIIGSVAALPIILYYLVKVLK